ncbi:MAG: hypothetical protein ACR2O8_10475 [Rhizobiaceae bacterium]
MNPSASLFDFAQTSLPLATYETGRVTETGQNCARIAVKQAPAPRLVKSVVDEAGLGKFVYLQGASGRRYVFSSIRREQATLYDHALFAATDQQGGVKLAERIDGLTSHACAVYVHLLGDELEAGMSTLDDLCAAG